jgi:hypothetical protein
MGIGKSNPAKERGPGVYGEGAGCGRFIGCDGPLVDEEGDNKKDSDYQVKRPYAVLDGSSSDRDERGRGSS